ncbi:S-layer homology domain-containing protein [Robertmurraya sp.]|uniref:S-layer homology domain-containing protein n=1 Tax=Robertmurraya sp. TaxID=2837525 RepID=UPI003703CED3
MKKLFFALSILFLVHGSAYAETGFSDVNSHWAKDTVQWAIEQKITNGYPDGTFRPNKNVTEAEFLALYINAFLNSKGDLDKQNEHVHVKEHPWFEHVYQVSKNYSLPIKSTPNKPIIRMRVAEVVVGGLGVNFEEERAIKYLLVNGLSSGKSAPTVEGFKGAEAITRAEALQFIKNIKEKGIDELKSRPTELSDWVTMDRKYEEYAETHESLATMLIRRLKEAGNIVLPTGYSQEYVDSRITEVYQLVKNAEMVDNGKKVRIYLPQKFKEDEWVVVETYDRVNGSVKEYLEPWSTKIPVYKEYTVDSTFAFSISLRKEGQIGAAPFANGGYNSKTKKISVNNKTIEENVVLTNE